MNMKSSMAVVGKGIEAEIAEKVERLANFQRVVKRIGKYEEHIKSLEERRLIKVSTQGMEVELEPADPYYHEVWIAMLEMAKGKHSDSITEFQRRFGDVSS